MFFLTKRFISLISVFCIGIAIGVLANSFLFSNKKNATFFGYVNSVPIQTSYLNALLKERFAPNGGSFESLDFDSRRVILEEAFAVKLLANKVLKDRQEKERSEQGQVKAYELDSLLEKYYVAKNIKKYISYEEMRTTYLELVKNLKGQHNFWYRQIVLPSQEDAINVIAELQLEKPFSKLAELYSIDTSTAANGGEVSALAETSIEPIIVENLRKLEAEKHSQPFLVGNKWYIVQFLKSAEIHPLSFEDSQKILRNTISSKRRKQEIDRLKSQNKVTSNLKLN